MNPRMLPEELALFLAFVKKSERYVEFGTGGSTFVASSHVKDWIISIDSSEEWLGNVAKACAKNVTKPQLHFVNIGPTGEWGRPTDSNLKFRWSDYHSEVWKTPQSAEADLYFVDGRFRVACFAQTYLRCQKSAIIGFHDFKSRKHYHVIYEIAKEIAAVEDMSFFVPMVNKRHKAEEILNAYKFNPD